MNVFGKIKRNHKRIMAYVLALVMLVGVIPMNPTTASAASSVSLSSMGRKGTVSFGSKSKSGTWWKMRVGGKEAFCLDLGHTCHSGNSYEVTQKYNWSQSTGGEKHGYYAKIVRWYVLGAKRSKKSFVMSQALVWSVAEGRNSESQLKDVIKQVKSNTGYYSSKSVNEMYQTIFEPSGNWTADVTIWQKTGNSKSYQRLMTVDADKTRTFFPEELEEHTYYRQRITVKKKDEDGKGLGGIQFTLNAENLDDLYSFSVSDRDGLDTGGGDEDNDTSFSLTGHTMDSGRLAFRMTYRLQSESYFYFKDSDLKKMSSDEKKAAKKALIEDEELEEGVDFGKNMTKAEAESLAKNDLKEMKKDISNTYTLIEDNTGDNKNLLVDPEYAKGKKITLKKADSWEKNADGEWPDKLEDIPSDYTKAYTVGVTNKYKKAGIRVVKSDEYSADGKAHGEAKLDGAEFGLYADQKCSNVATVYDAKGNAKTAGTYKISNGQLTTDYLRSGSTYYLKETKAPVGYVISQSVVPIKVDASKETVEYTPVIDEKVFKNKPILGKVAIQKYYSDGDTGELAPEKNTTFLVYLKSKGSYDNADHYERSVIKTDENGYGVTDNLYYGTYVVHQQDSGDVDAIHVDDFEVQVTEDGKVYTYPLNNKLFKAYLKILKKDGKTEKQVLKPGTTYQIYKVTDQGEELVTQSYSNGSQMVKVDKFVSDESGEVMTVKPLRSATYRIYEVEAASGLHISTEFIEVTINSKADNYESYKDEEGNTHAIVTVSYTNEETYGKLAVSKTGEMLTGWDTEKKEFIYEQRSLKGAKFEIYADGDIVTQDNQGTNWFKDGDKVAALTTGIGAEFTSDANGICGQSVDEDGVVHLTLPLGKYKVKEVETLYGYVFPDKNEWNLEFTWKNGKDEFVLNSTADTDEKGTMQLTNMLAKTQVQLLKQDADSKEAIEGAVFGLYSKHDMNYVSEGSFLEGLGEDSLRLRLRDTLRDSISYMLLTRCGIRAEDWLEDEAFSYLYEMNTNPVVAVIGNATMELTSPILIEMGKVVGYYDRQIRSNKGRNSSNVESPDTLEENLKKGLAKAPESEYNAFTKQTPVRILRREDFDVFRDFNIKNWYIYDTVTDRKVCYCDSEQEAWEHIEWMVEHNQFYRKKERNGENYGTDIREERRLSDSESGGGRAAGGEADEVRTNEGDVPERTSQGSIQRTSSGRKTEGALPHDSASGRGENGVSEQTDRREGERKRGTESQRSDEVGENDEQHSSESRGDNSGRDYLPSVDKTQEEPEFVENTVSGSFSVSEESESPYQQLDLFSSFGEQLGAIAVATAEQGVVSVPNKEIPEEWIDEILKTGGGKDNSRKRIYAKYQQGKDVEYLSHFLASEYGTTGKGFEFGDTQISMWADESGISLSYGTSAREHPTQLLSWSEAEKRIRSMVENGTYMAKQEAYLVYPVERERIASRLFFFYRDGFGEFPEQIQVSGSNYPEAIEKLVAMMESSDGIEVLTGCLEQTKEKLDSGELTMRFSYLTPVDTLLQELADIKEEPKKYPLADELDIKTESFITQDEIDYELMRGSNVSRGVFRIYDYVREGHSQQEFIAFLKEEYGTGGKMPALAGSDKSSEDHDAKGIRLRKGNIMNPDVDVLLSWNVVAKRIVKLVQEERYFTPKSREAYIKYRAEKEQKALEQAQQELLTDADAETPDDTIVDEPETVEEIVQSNAENYHITDDGLGVGSPKEKFTNNMAAIETLKRIESERRIATLEEQEILSKYVGWGGLADVFDEGKPEWSTEYHTLKNMLSDEEYSAARGSTLNAHYTSPEIIRTMYQALEKLGFDKGNILEPSMGIGNFFGMLPESMQESRLYGVELDSITGRIAKQLYPKANVTIDGFEKTEYPDDFFDVAIGNVPFGQYKVVDKKYDKHNFLIHDYFFAKTLDKVRPGGVVAFITSKGTLDKKSPMVRKYLAQRAELLGAIRLPNTAFKANAGTEVTSDIIFLKKRDRIMDIEPDWVHLSEDENGISMNSYFVEHPEMIVGHMEMVSGPYGMESTCSPETGTPFSEQIGRAIQNIEGEIDVIELDELSEDLVMDTIPADPNVKNYSYTVLDGRVYYRENSIMRPEDVSESMQERIKGMVALRDCTQELINIQLEDSPDDEILAKQKELNDLYDAFSKKYGIINSRTNRRAFNQDSSYCLLCSLEKLDDEGNFLAKADMFTKRTIQKAKVVTSVDTASEALAVSLAEKARIDLPYMAELSGKTEDTIIGELQGIIFKNPLTEQYETSDEYLSGNVRDKLHTAETFAENHPEYQINVESLKRVQPKELDASEIEVRLGATWVETHYMQRKIIPPKRWCPIRSL